ncbi:hypothetical protein [Kocuria rosea]|uniref:hypothetical protein n=1 Tax=Kocuria rosea TaxID=1275 RepID=UPI001643DC3E|nr:hypothetical protein [Kocuria rosea]
MSEHIYNGDPTCYPCQGTGKVIGFGSNGKDCDCQNWCDNHDKLCTSEDDE